MAKRHANRFVREPAAAAGDNICATDHTTTPVAIEAFGPQTPIITEEGIMEAMYPQENTLLIYSGFGEGRKVVAVTVAGG